MDRLLARLQLLEVQIRTLREFEQADSCCLLMDEMGFSFGDRLKGLWEKYQEIESAIAREEAK